MALIFSLLFEKATAAGQLLAGNPQVPAFAVLALLNVAAALTCFREKRWGYVYAAGLNIFILLLYNVQIVTYLYTPTNTQFFLGALSATSVLPLIIFFSIQSFRNSGGMAQKNYLASPVSAGGLLTVAVIGFLIGGSLVGVTSAGTIGSLLSNRVEQANAITIVKGASYSSNPQFYSPATVTVVIGKNNTVTWFNGDDTVHTVTGVQGLFDSGNVNPGGSWSYTFTQPGTYSYYCTIHPYMKGTIVVKQG